MNGHVYYNDSIMELCHWQGGKWQTALGGGDAITQGPSCPAKKDQKTGNPVRIATGDKEVTETDFAIGPLRMVRRYHSQSDYSGHAGYGWTWSYGWKLTQTQAGQMSIRRADGKLMTFSDEGTGVYRRRLERFDETVVASGTGWRYTKHDRSTVDFDASGNLVSLNTEDGQSTTVAYDTAGNPVSVTGPHGRTLILATDANGRITSVTGPLGRVWSYAYDVNSNLISVTHPDGTTRQYAYADPNDIHNLTSITDEAGRLYKRVTYDAQDRATLSELPLTGVHNALTYNADGSVDVTEADGTVRHYTVTTVNGIPSVTATTGGACNCGTATNFTLDPATGLLTGEADKNGVANNYTYDTNGRLLTKTEAVGTPVERTTTWTYDAAGHVATSTDALGNVTSYTYDALGRRLTTTDPLGNVTTNAWNPDGTLASRTDAAGNTTSYAYDAFGQVTSITNPDGTSHSMTYDAAGRLVTLTDETGATTTYAYDARDRVTSITYADGTSITNTYDAAGDLVSSTDAAGLTTTYTYDVQHRPLTVTRPDGSIVNSTFNAKGNLTARSVLDAAGVPAISETMTYDADGDLLSTTHADATFTSATYDAVGRLLTTTDEGGKTTTRTYDELGRLATVTDPAGGIVAYGYDALDRRIRVTAANGVTTTYAYDAAGRITQEASNDRSLTNYTYNATGDLFSKTDGNGIVTNYAYDAMHRLTGISYPADATRNVSFAYDAAGHVTQMTDAGGVTNYTHDVMGHVTSAAWSPAGSALTLTVAYGYDASGRLSTITYPTGRIVTYTYDTSGRINAVNTGINGTTANLVTAIAYNAFGNITSRTLGNGIVETRSVDNRGRLTAITDAGVLDRALTWNPDSTIAAITDNLNPANSQSFSYDPADRLINASGGYGINSYTYDANGNRLSRSAAAGAVSSTYEPASNRLASSGTTAYMRDVAGNRLSDNQFNYTYAVNNRLIAVHDAAGTSVAGYVHNGRGQRISKTDAAGNETRFIYGQMGELLAEADATGAVFREYIYLNGNPVAVIAVGSGTTAPTEQILDNSDTTTAIAGDWTGSTGVNGYYGSDYRYHAANGAPPGGIIVDNTAVVFTGDWTGSTGVSGYYGSDYRYHAANGAPPGGIIVDNTAVVFTGDWTGSTGVSGYYGSDYRYHAANGAPPGGIIVDNTAATVVGTWTGSTGVSGYYAGDYQYHAAGTGANSITWNPVVTTAGDYNVYTRWTAHPNRAGNASYAITHAGGSATVTVNQQQNGGQWNLLGTYHFAADGTARIVLTDQADGYVIADAVKLTPVGAAPNSATWNPVVTTAGDYNVYTRWTSHPNRAGNASYAITHAGGSATVTVNQQQNGGQWNLLGTYHFAADGTARIVLTDQADGYVIADAVKLTPVGAPPNSVTWQPSIAQPGSYEVYARWTAHPNRADNAPYTITHADGSTTVTVNQRQNGGQWNLLGVFTLNASSTITLTDVADGYVIADAIRLVGSAASTSSSTYYIHNDHLGTPQAMTDINGTVVWTLSQTPFGIATVNEDPDGDGIRVRNNFRFPGQYFDAETGLNYNYFRTYDPATGRYTQHDPIGLNGGMNPFGYVGGNPVTGTDPFSLVKWKGWVYSGLVSGIFGGAQFSFDLKSECVNGKSAYVNVYASAVMTGLGAKVTGGATPIEFDDANLDLDPYVFQGTFRFFSAGFGVGLTGGASYFQLGKAFTDPSKPWSPGIGFDASFGASIFGRSIVWSANVKNCQCGGRP